MLRSTFSTLKKTALPYVADAGGVAFTAIAAFVLAVVALEFASPGSAVSAVAPQALVVAAVVAGGVALADVSTPRTPRRRAWAVAAAVAAGVAFWASWYYFSSVPEVRAWLAAAIAFAVALLFAAAASPPPDHL